MEEKYSLALENIVSLGRYSFELERAREESLIRQAGEMLTAFSVFSAAILMAIPILIDCANIDKTKLFICIGVSIVPLIVSLVLSISAQWRFKYQAMQDAKQFQELIFASIQEYQCQDQYHYQWIDQLTLMHLSIEKNNNIRAWLVKFSMGFFLGSVFFLLVSIVCLFILS